MKSLLGIEVKLLFLVCFYLNIILDAIEPRHNIKTDRIWVIFLFEDYDLIKTAAKNSEVRSVFNYIDVVTLVN